MLGGCWRTWISYTAAGLTGFPLLLEAPNRMGRQSSGLVSLAVEQTLPWCRESPVPLGSRLSVLYWRLFSVPPHKIDKSVYFSSKLFESLGTNICRLGRFLICIYNASLSWTRSKAMSLYYSFIASSSAFHSNVNFKTWQRKDKFLVPSNFLMYVSQNYVVRSPWQNRTKGWYLSKGCIHKAYKTQSCTETTFFLPQAGVQKRWAWLFVHHANSMENQDWVFKLTLRLN